MAAAFITPANERSFSALVDAVVLATGKPQLLVSIVQYANATFRECQALGLFARDLIEDGILVPSTNQTSSYNWTRPSSLFRSLRTVKYINADVWPEMALPGRKQAEKDWYYYAADNYFVFQGVAPGETIAVAYYNWRQRLGYYGLFGVSTTSFPGGPYATRPAYYNTNTAQWMYLNGAGTAYVTTLGDPVAEAAAQALVTNWLIDDWYDACLSGTKAKVFNSGGDPRSTAEYSLYKQFQKTLAQTVAYESEGF